MYEAVPCYNLSWFHEAVSKDMQVAKKSRSAQAAEKLAALPASCPADLESAMELLERVYGAGNG